MDSSKTLHEGGNGGGGEGGSDSGGGDGGSDRGGGDGGSHGGGGEGDSRGGGGDGGGDGGGKDGGREQLPGGDPREPQSLQSVPRSQKLYKLPEPPSSQYPSHESEHVLEHGSQTVPPASERFWQYSHGEVQDLYQVTPDTLQQYGTPGSPGLHTYVSEHALGMLEPLA